MGLGWVVPDTPGEEAGLPVLGEKSQGEADTRIPEIFLITTV